MLQDFVKKVFHRFGFSLRRMRGVKTPDGALIGEAIGSDGGELMRAIHAVDPHEGFDSSGFPEDEHGWGSQSATFGLLVERVRPKLVIEVGTWKGASAIEICGCLDRCGLGDTRVLCVDTWLGALEMWGDQADEARYGSLALEHGYPRLYYQFLANVHRRGLQQRIIPFPLPSVTAAQWLSLRGVQADLIYIDGSHEEEDVYADLCSSWELLAPGGVLFGDDYAWTGVQLAVDRFAAESRLPLEHLEDKWTLSKKA